MLRNQRPIINSLALYFLGGGSNEMNMFKPVGAKTTDEYIALLNDERREAIEFLVNFIQKTAPSLKLHFAYNMLGFGKFKYTNYKKQELDWPTVALASQKNHMSLYVCSVEDGVYIAEKFKNDLGKVNVGKSCIRFKKLDDLNLDTLKEVIKAAEKNPGLEYAVDKKKK
jgi:uncharacterized protein YdhG (YjbR/CyaY superfamily)